MESFSVTPIEKEKKEKPPVLYHASSRPDIAEFAPKQERIRDPEEGPAVFATSDKALASIFLVEGHEDSWTKIGYYSGIPTMIIRSDKDGFIAKDKGGTIYSLPNDTFDFHSNRGMGEKEWTSQTPVKPTAKETSSSALESMIENDVQVYFVDQMMFENIRKAKDHGLGILLSLQSENESRGLKNPLKQSL